MKNLFNLKTDNNTTAFFIAFIIKQIVLLLIISIAAYFSNATESTIRIKEHLNMESDFATYFIGYLFMYSIVSSIIIFIKTIFGKKFRLEKVGRPYVYFLVYSSSVFLMAVGISLIISGIEGVILIGISFILYGRLNSIDDMLKVETI